MAAQKGISIRSLFDDLSGAQVIAGALAAATSLFLASYIGVAGSIIGAAIASVVSTVSSQVYKKMLSASAEKLREASPFDAAPVSAGQEVGQQATRVMPAVQCNVDSLQTTHVLSPVSAERRAGAGLKGDSSLQQARARRHRKQRAQRRVLAVSVVSSIIVVAVVAALIQLGTGGEGVGSKPDPVFSQPVVQTDASQETAGAASAAQSGEDPSATSAEDETGTDNSSDAAGDSSGSAGSGSSDSGQSGANASGASGSDASSDGSGSTGGSSAGQGSGAGGSASGSGSSSGSTDAVSSGSSGN